MYFHFVLTCVLLQQKSAVLTNVSAMANPLKVVIVKLGSGFTEFSGCSNPPPPYAPADQIVLEQKVLILNKHLYWIDLFKKN